ncbi:MAG: hypothetical protein ACXWM7_04760 [Parachlamydiaceae bacterium]
MHILFVIFMILCSCTKQESTTSHTWEHFCCRDEGDPLQRIPLYRAKVPSHWTRKNPDLKISILDSTQPNVEFIIAAPHLNESIYVTVHTFPTDTIEKRIPPQAQINRWKKQFIDLDPTSVKIVPRARGGFSGLSFYGEGIQHEKEHAVLAYSMEIAPTHWAILQPNERASFKQKQMAASYTIKAQGQPEALRSNQNEIFMFANSFELIEEIPSR